MQLRVRTVAALLSAMAIGAVGMFVLREVAEPPVPQEAAPVVLPDDPEVIVALKELGGEVFTDPHGRVVKVILVRCPVTDEHMPLLANLQELRTLNLRGTTKNGPGITDAGLESLAELRNLRVLELSANFAITNSGLKSLQNLTKLEDLNLSGTRISNAGLEYLKNLRSLRHLHLNYAFTHRETGERIGCTQEGLPALWGLPIEELHGVDVNRKGLRYLAGLTHLKSLPGVFIQPADSDLVHLKNLTRLESLSVGLSDGWSDTSRLETLAAMQGLKALEVSGEPAADGEFDARSLAALVKLSALERLRLGRISDVGIEHLPESPQVRLLDLSVSEIKGPGLAYLAEKFPQLEALSLDPTTLTMSGLEQLPTLTHLRMLHLDGIPFRGEGLSHLCPQAEFKQALKEQLRDDTLSILQKTPHLQEISLKRMNLTDAALAHLVHTPALQVLNVQGTNMTDAALVHLRQLPELRDLMIEGTHIGYDAAAAFHQQVPGCRIHDNWCCGCMTFEPVQVTNRTLPTPK